jgi:hypothetical protein
MDMPGVGTGDDYGDENNELKISRDDGDDVRLGN